MLIVFGKSRHAAKVGCEVGVVASPVGVDVVFGRAVAAAVGGISSSVGAAAVDTVASVEHADSPATTSAMISRHLICTADAEISDCDNVSPLYQSPKFIESFSIVKSIIFTPGFHKSYDLVTARQQQQQRRFGEIE